MEWRVGGVEWVQMEWGVGGTGWNVGEGTYFPLKGGTSNQQSPNSCAFTAPQPPCSLPD